MSRLRAGLALGWVIAAFVPAPALQPDQVFLVTNSNLIESRGIAEHYCRKRNVPADHILALDLPTGEVISRRDYNGKLVVPLRKRLAHRRDEARVLLTIYGVPLRVEAQEPGDEERKELDRVGKELGPLQEKEKTLTEAVRRLGAGVSKNAKGPPAEELAAKQKDLAEASRRVATLEARRRWLSYTESQAAVDSELSLLWFDNYNLRGAQLNPHYFQVPPELRHTEAPVLLTCRLDGPSPALVKRLIDQSVAVEATGLDGKVYVDARGLSFDPKTDSGTGYGAYDESLREMANLLAREKRFVVVLDNKPELFPSGSCTSCALYCGWYSVGKYVDCCRFVPGAVAYHIASFEATTLRDPKSTQWCKSLLEAGAVATLGPVAEPYTFGFPKPAEFFGFLVSGEYTLVECYWKTMLFTSWMTTLVGDPLYNPFARAPRLKAAQVPPSPRGKPIKFAPRTTRPHPG